MPPLPEIPTSLMASFTTRNQTELRKLLGLVYAAAAAEATGFKFIEEQGDAADSGTILSTSEIVATVASQDGDITGSSNSVLVGGDTNTLSNVSNSTVLGGTINTITSSTFNGGILGGTTNFVIDSTNSAIVGGNGGEVANCENSVICGGVDNTAGGQRTFIGGGLNNNTTANDCMVTGQGGIGDRRWSFTLGGGDETNTLVQRAQTVVASGGVSSADETTAMIYFGPTYLPLGEDTTAFVDLIVQCVNPANNASYAWRYELLAKRVGAAATTLVVNDSVFSDGDASLSTVTVVPSGVALGIQVACTGLALTPLSFTATALLNEQRIV